MVRHSQESPQRKRHVEIHHNCGEEAHTLGSLVLQLAAKNKPKKTPKDYSFKTSDILAINPHKLLADLTSTNPICYTKFRANEGEYVDTGVIVCIHSSIGQKAMILERTIPCKDLGIKMGEDHFVIDLPSTDKLRAIIDWVREIKSTRWPDKQPGNVKVTFPKM